MYKRLKNLTAIKVEKKKNQVMLIEKTINNKTGKINK